MDESTSVFIGVIIGLFLAILFAPAYPPSVDKHEKIAVANKHAHYDKTTGDLVWDNLEICSYLYRRECE